VLTCESEESGLDHVLEAAGGDTVLKDICEARDLSLAQKERILGRNVVEFFGLGNLPEPTAVKAARRRWTREDSREATAAQGALR